MLITIKKNLAKIIEKFKNFATFQKIITNFEEMCKLLLLEIEILQREKKNVY